MARELKIAIDPHRLPEIQADPEKLRILVKCAQVGGFREFLKYWYFRNQNTGEVILLGDVLWSGQEKFVASVASEPKLYALKARKLGYTTIECAWDAYVARFRDQNARVHLFSRRQASANELLEAVKFGLDRLPPWMRLPYTMNKTDEMRMDAGVDDERIIKAYPADEDTAVEATCSHGHVDEWARMGNPRRVWQAIEPSMAGSCHIITTGMGPANFTATFWRKTIAGDSGFKDFFMSALERADRDAAWLEQKRLSMEEKEFRQEYAMTWKDALFGGGEFVFTTKSLDQAQIDTLGPQLPDPERKYIKAWDVGRHNDAAVGVVLDVTEDVVDVVHYVRLRGVPYPELQRRIEAVHEAYPGLTVIEKNSAGEAVAENLELPDHEVELFNTSAVSKSRILKGLVIAFQKEVLKYRGDVWTQLDAELRGYQIPDDQIVQDSVMALAIGYDYVGKVHLRGRAGRIMAW